MKEGVSIIVCTYNGARRLPDTIAHIARQKASPEIPWEFIIVDNASTDGSAAVAYTEWNKHHCNAHFSIVHQPKIGLTNAREKGFEEAQYNYIVLCDDDNWLAPDYVNIAFEVMQRHPSIGMLGGNGEFVYEIDPPHWLHAYQLYAGGPQAEKSGKVETNLLYGAGSILRKSAYYLIKNSGFNSMLTDRMASQLTSGGDYELCYALVLAGYEIWYDERLRFKHFITKDRLTWEYYLKYIRESSVCFEVLEPYKIFIETVSPKVLNFRLRLFRSFLYHVKKIIPVIASKLITSHKSKSGKIKQLQYIALKTRLLSYLGYACMKQNFLKVVALRQKLLPQVPIKNVRYTSNAKEPHIETYTNTGIF